MTQLLDKFGFVNTYGTKVGHCNICDSYGLLTEDHIPPKGTLGIPQANLLHIIELLSAERPEGKKKKRQMQSGVNFRSLCERCNSSLLGAKYDPELIKFSNSVTLFLKSEITLPEITTITIIPGLVARSVLGHLFALGIERRERTRLLIEAVEFFNDTNRPLPEEIEIYYWVYPYRRQVAVRDGALLSDFLRSPPIVFWCLKYFPLGFIITWGNKELNRIALPRLRNYMLNAGMHPANIPLYLKSIPHQNWPEEPEENGAVLYGDGAIGAIPNRG